MKMRRIPEIDLARIAVLPETEQSHRLSSLKSFRPPHTLNPFRATVSDIMNRQYELLGGINPTAWSSIEAKILASKESSDGKDVNIAVARALFDFVSRENLISFDKPVARWAVGFENSVEYWQQFYSVWRDKASFVFFDPRRSNPLTREAMRFVFSMMHQRLRVDDPDFANVDLTIFSFGLGDESSRTVRIHNAHNFELFSRDDLNSMISLTYRLWAEELAGRQEQARRASGSANPMGF